jgi:hypothetical protein
MSTGPVFEMIGKPVIIIGKMIAVQNLGGRQAWDKYSIRTNVPLVKEMDVCITQQVKCSVVPEPVSSSGSVPSSGWEDKESVVGFSPEIIPLTMGRCPTGATMVPEIVRKVMISETMIMKERFGIPGQRI